MYAAAVATCVSYVIKWYISVGQTNTHHRSLSNHTEAEKKVEMQHLFHPSAGQLILLLKHTSTRPLQGSM